MAINYQRTTIISPALIDLETDEQGLYVRGLKNTAGAPVTTAGYFQRGCIIQNTASGVVYANTGTTAIPVWSTVDVT
jgi:hypothetical protein